MIGAADPATDLPDRVRLPFRFDAAALAADVAGFAEADWVRHPVRQNYDGQWSVLPLRAPAGETHPIRMIYPDPCATAFVDTPLLDRAPAVRAALAHFHCRLRTVRLLRLAPGSTILRHVDSGLDPENGMLRIHIPVWTEPDVRFLLNDVPVAMTPGSAWYLRLSDPHEVMHRGKVDRVHLVVDCWSNDWLLAALHGAAAA
ncbi:MAG: aspartyl/asparaginyl beta-hydroxylase domain-containing protein [Sphingomonadaceae bacterium]|nr:aspartyl/asparaginyl beta-hydroxylase domain-containing protein [Sphingomonadaceae bacterium]